MGAETKTVTESLRTLLPDRFLIVIGRQYGSGGRKIGRYIADALGIPYYDKTLLREAAPLFQALLPLKSATASK